MTPNELRRQIAFDRSRRRLGHKLRRRGRATIQFEGGYLCIGRPIKFTITEQEPITSHVREASHE